MDCDIKFLCFNTIYMSAALLAKLRVKNLPKRPDTVEIVIRQPEAREEIAIKTKIVDKRAATGFDREAFLVGIKDARPIADKTIKPR